MRLEWLETEVAASCPVCLEPGAKKAIAAMDPVLPAYPRVTLLRCPRCGAAFLDNLTVPDYGNELAGIVDYYVEQGAGIDIMVAPLFRLPRGGDQRLLEIGCGFGFALDFARHAFGWDVQGVDPSSLAAAGAAALGLPIAPAYFGPELASQLGTFEIILCSEILEHVPEPHSLLRSIRERLSPDGLLVLTTPNLAIIQRDSPEGWLARALSPGLHLVLYSKGALQLALEKAGFTAVVIEESPETLRAFAACGPAAVALVDYEPGTARTLLRAYLDYRSDTAPAGSALASGLAYRHFKECVNGGLHAEALESRKRLARVYREGYSIEFLDPASWEMTSAAPPFNLTGSCFFSGILELNETRRFDLAAAYFAASVAAGQAMQASMHPFGLYDGETEVLLAQSRKHLPMALAGCDPQRAVTEIQRLRDDRPIRGEVSPALLREAEEQTFVRLVIAGAYESAALLAPRIQEGLDYTALRRDGESTPGSLDPPFCLGMLALQQGRPGEAAGLFGLVYEAASRRPHAARAELLWSARHHEAMSLLAAGTFPRHALEELVAPEPPPGLPRVPALVAEAAREMLSSRVPTI